MTFEIFKTGTHTNSKGESKDYSLDDLNFIADSYNPSDDEAPIVIGHPADNSPAFGWIDSLKVVGDKLIAKAKQVLPEFSDALNKGLYKKRSVSLTPDGKLRHVGFLGAAPPAVKGLTDIQFSQPSSSEFEFELSEEFSEEPPEPSKPLETINQDDFNAIKSELAEVKKLLLDLELSNPPVQPDDSVSRNDLVSFLDSKVSDGFLTPAVSERILAVSDFVSSDDFSESSKNEFSGRLNHLFTELVKSFPKIIHFDDFAEKPEFENDKVKSEFEGMTLDEESSQLHNKAVSLMRKEKISYTNALKKIIAA